MNNTKKSIIFLAASFFLLVIIGGLYSYAFIWIKNENEYTSGLASQLLTESQKKEDELRLIQAIKETDENHQKLDSYFVKGDGSVEFLGIIEEYSDASNAQGKFVSVDYDAVKKELTMNLHITGTFVDVYQNLIMLENAPYEFDFRRIIFSKDGGQVADPTKKISNVPIWSADINFALKSISIDK